MKPRAVPGDPSSCIVRVRCGGTDSFDRVLPDKVDLKVTHHDGYGVLVSGAVLGGVDITLARRALKKAGYEKDDYMGWSYRPTMVDQNPGRWPFGLWVGGIPAVAFYFKVEA